MGFNSRAHRGRDVSAEQVTFGKGFQFTRPQGARRCILCTICCLEGFNSRAHRGRDNNKAEKLLNWYEFQFTRPQGARLMLL